MVDGENEAQKREELPKLDSQENVRTRAPAGSLVPEHNNTHHLSELAHPQDKNRAQQDKARSEGLTTTS